MLGRHHSLSGAVVWLAGCVASSSVGLPPGPLVVVAGGGVCALAALIPDIDHEGSMIARSCGPLTRLIAWGVRATCGHRGLTHTAVSAVVVGLVSAAAAGGALGWAWWWLGVAVGVGHLVHILGDCCTISGCPLLWPIRIGGDPWRRVGLWRPLRFRTGGWVEQTLVGPGLAVAGLASAWLALT